VSYLQASSTLAVTWGTCLKVNAKAHFHSLAIGESWACSALAGGQTQPCPTSRLSVSFPVWVKVEDDDYTRVYGEN
jgi:hypothetical protein